MSITLTLPVSKASVTLREVSGFKQREREAIYNGTDGITNAMTGGWKIVKNTLVILVEDWDLELPLPKLDKDPDLNNSLGELDAADFDFLTNHAQTALELLWPNLAKTVENETNPKAPTANSNA